MSCSGRHALGHNCSAVLIYSHSGFGLACSQAYRSHVQTRRLAPAQGTWPLVVSNRGREPVLARRGLTCWLLLVVVMVTWYRRRRLSVHKHQAERLPVVSAASTLISCPDSLRGCVRVFVFVFVCLCVPRHSHVLWLSGHLGWPRRPRVTHTR